MHRIVRALTSCAAALAVVLSAGMLGGPPALAGGNAGGHGKGGSTTTPQPTWVRAAGNADMLHDGCEPLVHPGCLPYVSPTVHPDGVVGQLATATGPVAGAVLTFNYWSLVAGPIGPPFCTVTTDATGTALCPVGSYVPAGEFIVTFSGDATYAASSGTSSFVTQ